jgi:branched-chain amino acid transport system ATP-binding protein
MEEKFLEMDGVTKQYGSITAVDDVNLSISEGGITSIIGPNGAGKTTMMNLIVGIVKATDGHIRLQGDRIDNSSPHEIVDQGIAKSAQVTNIFPDLTVRENIRLAAQARYTGFHPSQLLKHYTSLDKATRKANEILEQTNLIQVAEERAADVSRGDRRALDISIALATFPDLLILDEPTAGMSPDEVASVKQLIEKVSEDTTVLFVEHNVDLVLDISDQIIVLTNGSVLKKGEPEEIRRSQQVQDAYLGGEV